MATRPRPSASSSCGYARQLTWQRNYNTQPRHLGDAQGRLTHAIAEVILSTKPSYSLCCKLSDDAKLDLSITGLVLLTSGNND